MNYKFGLIATAALLMACSSDNDTDPEPQPQPSERRISVVVGENPMIPEGGEAKTRAAITTTSTLSEFWLQGVVQNNTSEYDVKRTLPNAWTLAPNIWPDVANDASVPFYAHTFHVDHNTPTCTTFYPNDGNPYISFTVPENAFEQHDLLVAKTSTSYNANSGKVYLTFDHACAAVDFYVQITDALKSSLQKKTLTIHSIIMKNVYRDGKYYYNNNPHWSIVTEGNNTDIFSYYTLTNSNLTFSKNNDDFAPQHLPCDYVFIIPQNRTANGTSGMYLEVAYTISGESQKTANIPMSVNWQEGYQYTVNIRL